jgi:hypothetical protein
MRFPSLRYTLPSFPGVSILYRVTMSDRPELLRFASELGKSESGGDIEVAIENERRLVELVGALLVAVDFDGESELLPDLPEERADWLSTNFHPRAVQESFTAILSGRFDEAFLKK